jgi:hypothetical protein
MSQNIKGNVATCVFYLQIEVDIDPPHSSSGLSDAKLEELGLPTHHVHFTAASSQQVIRVVIMTSQYNHFKGL